MPSRPVFDRNLALKLLHLADVGAPMRAVAILACLSDPQWTACPASWPESSLAMRT
jgi:hypothetical protein